MGPVKEHIVPSALIINKKVGHTVLEQLISVFFTPRCFWILIVLSESHGRKMLRGHRFAGIRNVDQGKVGPKYFGRWLAVSRQTRKLVNN